MNSEIPSLYAAILANVARDVTLTPAEEALFTALLLPQQVARYDYLLQAGQAAHYLTFVNQGCVRTYASDAHGKESVLAFAVEGWWCADFASALARAPATLTLQALEDTQVWQLPAEQLEALYAQVPKFERFFRLLFQQGFVHQQRRLTDQLQVPAAVRFARFRRQYPRLSQRVAQRHIASYLGITPEFLSMLRKRQA